MPIAPVNGIEIFYETMGEDSDEPLVLVSGLGSQLISWEPEFCQLLVDRGFFVIRFDNRDTGLSTKFDHAAHTDFATSLQKAAKGEPLDVPYKVTDMAADAVGVLDHLGIDSAHFVGRSMGGMIVQTIAIEHPDRMRSMTSIMSMTGDPDVGMPTPEAQATLMRKPAQNRDEAIANHLETWKVLSGPGLFDEEWYRKRGEEAYDRCFAPSGVGRQLLGIMASGSRSDALRKVHVPTVVLHGTDDPLVGFSGGQRTAEVIPEAEFVALDGMGHDMPPRYWNEIVEAIVKVAVR